VILRAFQETATDRTRIGVHGDLDVTTGVELRRVLGALTTTRVELDLAHVAFLDCSGARTLLWADAHQRGRGGSMVILRPPGPVLRLIQLLELDRHLMIQRSDGTVGAARTAAGHYPDR
jgi:anti-anti-sigma factor